MKGITSIEVTELKEKIDEVITLLTPISNLAKFNITQINQQLEAQKVATERENRTSDEANKETNEGKE